MVCVCRLVAGERVVARRHVVYPPVFRRRYSRYDAGLGVLCTAERPLVAKKRLAVAMGQSHRGPPFCRHGAEAVVGFVGGSRINFCRWNAQCCLKKIPDILFSGHVCKKK